MKTDILVAPIFKCQHLYHNPNRLSVHRKTPATPEDEGFWQFKCPACKRKHRHGPFPGHRVSHCLQKDAFPQGYFLEHEKG